MTNLEGRTALVTGGGRGIGAAITRGLAVAGADVAINYTRDTAAATALAEEVRTLGRRAEIYQADVADPEQCESMSEKALEEMGPIGILVNNAGIASRGNSVTTEKAVSRKRRFAGSTNLDRKSHKKPM